MNTYVREIFTKIYLRIKWSIQDFYSVYTYGFRIVEEYETLVSKGDVLNLAKQKVEAFA